MRHSFFALLCVLLYLSSASGQTPKTDREEAGLKGKVRGVNAQAVKLSRDGKSFEGQNLLTYVGQYDEQGNLVESTGFDYRGNMRERSVYSIIDGYKTAKSQYFRHEYDPPPPAAPPSEGEPKPRDPRFDVRYIYKHDGNKVERTTFLSDGTQSSRAVMIYEKGNKVKVESYDRDGNLYFTSVTTYGDKGEELESTYYRGGSVSSRHKYTDYEIDLRGNWIKRKMWLSKSENEDFQPYELQSRTITYFDDSASQAMTNSPQPGASKPLVIRVNTGALAERAIKKVNPAYPKEAADAKISGEVLLEVSVDEGGNVASVEGVTGEKILIDAAIAAVRQWQFKPTIMGGKPVRVIGRLRFKFDR